MNFVELYIFIVLQLRMWRYMLQFLHSAKSFLIAADGLY